MEVNSYLQLRTIIFGILALSAVFLFFRGDQHFEAAVEKTNEWRSKSWLSRESDVDEEQSFPVITVCPMTNEFGSQIRELSCTAYGPESDGDQLLVVPQQVSISTENNDEEVFDCFTTNEQQDFYGTNSSHFIRCDVTYNENKAVNPGRFTIWGNPDVWTKAVFQAPSASSYRWSTFFQERTTTFRYQLTKYSPRKSHNLWLTELNYDKIVSHWNTTEENERSYHSSFTLSQSEAMAMQLNQKEGGAGLKKKKNANSGGNSKASQGMSSSSSEEEEEEDVEKPSTMTVFVCTMLMALATGLGSIPFYFTDRLSKFWEGVSQSTAVGVMIAASYALIQESEGFNDTWLVVGIFLGMVFIDRSQKFLHNYEEKMEFSGLKGMDAKKIVLFLGIMTLHAVGEGCGVGVSYAGPHGFPKGLVITLAIALHNIPEGLATATILASKGVGRKELTMWCIITALPQSFLAVPAYIFVQFFSVLFPFFAGFAAGCMIWISFAEIVPDALENISPTTLATGATATTCLFKAMQYTVDKIVMG